jgi:hypothetical protein
MGYYNNIFASSFKFFSRFERETPLFSATCVVTVCQFTLVFLICTIIKIYTRVNPFIIFPNKYYGIPVVPIWIFAVSRYYRKARVEEIVNRFNEKSLLRRRIWAIVTIVSLMLPTVFIAYLIA